MCVIDREEKIVHGILGFGGETDDRLEKLLARTGLKLAPRSRGVCWPGGFRACFLRRCGFCSAPRSGSFPPTMPPTPPLEQTRWFTEEVNPHGASLRGYPSHHNTKTPAVERRLYVGVGAY